jgi:hypothetical protein
MSSVKDLQPIVVYIIEKHSLEQNAPGPSFRWLHFDNNYKRQLRQWIGPHDPESVSFLIDEGATGDAWDLLFKGLHSGKIKHVITHLAPLYSAQRHVLISTCAEVGAQLVTPSDAGRNRESEETSQKGST